MLVQLLEKLINKKYYETKQEIESKLNVFYAMNKITDEEYSSLILKAEEIYTVIEETIIEDIQATEEVAESEEK